MRKLLIPAFCLGLALACSCKNKENRETAAAAATAPAQAGSVSAELFYQLTIERLGLDNEVNAGYLEILKAAADYDQALEDRISGYEKQAVQKYQALREKYQTSFADLEKMGHNQAMKSYLDDYLNLHPEVKKQIEDREQEKTRLENAISVEMNRLHPPPPAPLPGQTVNQ